MTETNPYQSPAVTSHTTTSSQGDAMTIAQRRSAVVSVRIAILLLLVSGLFNYYAFDTFVIGNAMPAGFHTFLRVINLGGIFAVTALSWFLLVPGLEVLARFVRHLSGRQSTVSQWNEAIYRSLRPAAYLAIPGTILWGIWVAGFYFGQLNFTLLSLAIGVPAHLLAAGLYVPLIVRWYLLARTTSEGQHHEVVG